MSILVRSPRRGRRLIAITALGCAAALAAAGCSSGSGSASAGTSASVSTVSANVKAAQAVVAQAMVRPTAISVSTPIGKPVPGHQKLVFISCGVAVCEMQGKIVADAAAALGWQASTISTDGSPAQIQAAYETAIRQGATMIDTTAANRAMLAAQLPKLIAKNIPVSDASSTDPISAPFIYNTSTSEQNTRIGKYLAAEVVADSGGKSSVVYVNLPAFAILGTLSQSFKQYYQQWCPGCGFDSIDVSLTQIASASNIIVSYLRSHPTVKYVALSVANALDNGLPAAISAAGLTGIKIVGQGGGPSDYQYLAAGQELALVPFDYYSVDYQMVDALARHAAGVPVELTAPPLWLITKANIPSDYTQLFPNVADYKSQFLKLWGK